ncbi:MAG: glycosyl hydrolase [Gemmatimonadaceae bacterium]|nr:glycosyl hydrolase [Gemmatimonadaceae bacterium]
MRLRSLPALLLAAPAVLGAQGLNADTAAYKAISWRNVGPWRGGRANAITGIPSMPLTYFVGYTGGGVWRTDNAGQSWRNISDGFFKTSTIGAIAIAPSDPNVIYVGSGEHAIRGQSSSYGDGVYKSTDQGRTWTNIGLRSTKQISAVRIHPQNPDIVWVAAQGDRWKGTPDRGVYRTMDGGKTWTLLLKGENATSGANDLTMDPTNPRILYAAMWDHQRVPWNVRSGGPGSGIWKTTDGGDTWTRLSSGLPRLVGKIGVSVSADPERVYAIVEADSGGLFRSDDAGRTWRRTSGDRLIQTRSWYYMKVTADPKNPDVLWVMNAPVMRSIDGGRTFQSVPATHGDNHQIWINPTNSDYLANANDGGGSISLDGGKTWSTQDNQPTAQFYHVTVDDDYPYKLYSGQQDNSSVVIRSRSDNGSIGTRDWWDGPGCESANVGVSARTFRYTYGGCYQGLINEVDEQTGLSRDIMAYPEMNLTEPTDKTKYRFNWTAPILVSQHDENTVFQGGNVLFRTRDRGQTWAPVSPDLSKNDKARQGWGGGPITNEGAGGEVYATIFVIKESPHDANTIYVGTDDGNVQLTRDGTRTWTNVTPPTAGDGLVNEIEVSPFDAATVYVAFRKDRVGDPAPYVFKSTDYGRTWTRLVTGLRENEPVRVVREDPERRGLLYAGTETGVYVSYDAGVRWQPFSGNLPVVPVTDIEVRHGDLIASTEGRAFWILDDLSVVRQHADSVVSAAAHLYKPRAAILSDAGGGFGAPTSAGRNPPGPAVVFYRLANAPDSATTVKVEFLDSRGAVLRSYSNREGTGNQRLAPAAGVNRVIWDLRRPAPTQLPGVLLFGAPSAGALATPGMYQVRLTVGTTTRTQPIEVRLDPRVQVTPVQIAERDSVAQLLVRRIGEMHDAVNRIRDVKTQVQGFVSRTKDADSAAAIAARGGALVKKVESIDPKLTTKAQNGQDIINFANGINGQFGFLLGQVEGNPVLTAGAKQRIVELERLWSALRAEVESVETDVEAFNRLLLSAKIEGVVAKKKTVVM